MVRFELEKYDGNLEGCLKKIKNFLDGNLKEHLSRISGTNIGWEKFTFLKIIQNLEQLIKTQTFQYKSNQTTVKHAF